MKESYENNVKIFFLLNQSNGSSILIPIYLLYLVQSSLQFVPMLSGHCLLIFFLVVVRYTCRLIKVIIALTGTSKKSSEIDNIIA